MMPQLQIFFLAMPVSILVGFVILLLTIGAMMNSFLDFFGTQMRVFARVSMAEERDDLATQRRAYRQNASTKRSKKATSSKARSLSTFVMMAASALVLALFAGNAARTFTSRVS